jgi:hypothetical protein
MVSASRLARPRGVPYSSGFSAMMSDHRPAMTSAREAYSSASPAESLRRASFSQSRQAGPVDPERSADQVGAQSHVTSPLYCRPSGGFRVFQVLWSLRMT